MGTLPTLAIPPGYTPPRLTTGFQTTSAYGVSRTPLDAFDAGLSLPPESMPDESPRGYCTSRRSRVGSRRDPPKRHSLRLQTGSPERRHTSSHPAEPGSSHWKAPSDHPPVTPSNNHQCTSPNTIPRHFHACRKAPRRWLFCPSPHGIENHCFQCTNPYLQGYRFPHTSQLFQHGKHIPTVPQSEVRFFGGSCR